MKMATKEEAELLSKIVRNKGRVKIFVTGRDRELPPGKIECDGPIWHITVGQHKTFLPASQISRIELTE